jgi:cation transport ATPase
MAILGRNRQELPISVAVVVLGLMLVVVTIPLGPYESHTPRGVTLRDWSYWTIANLFFALIGLFCAINACRDAEMEFSERPFAVIWLIILSVWVAYLFSSFSLMALGTLRPPTR